VVKPTHLAVSPRIYYRHLAQMGERVKYEKKF